MVNIVFRQEELFICTLCCAGIGDNDDTATAHSVNLENVEDEETEISCPVFNPRKLANLSKVDSIPSLSPIMDMRIRDIKGDGNPQLLALCGRSARSSLRMLSHGLHVNEIAISDMPGNPGSVFTIPGHDTDISDEDLSALGLPREGEIGREAYDKYIVVSFANASLVLSIGETVEEVSDSGFATNAPTLAATLLRDRAYLQITNASMRHIRAVGEERRVVEWKPPGKKVITHAVCNNAQAAIALSGGEIYYFELEASGELSEVANRELYEGKEDSDSGPNITALSLGAVPAARQRAPFLAVADTNSTVRILTLDPGSALQQLAFQAVNGVPESMLFVRMRTAATTSGSVSGATTASGAGVILGSSGPVSDGGPDESLFLFIGLQNGILQRTKVDKIAGTLQDTRTRFLGPRAVKLYPVTVAGHRAVLAVSARTWLCYFHEGRYTSTPLAYNPLEAGADFCSEVCSEGLVAVCGSTLRILNIDRVGESFDSTVIPLRYTPRKCALLPLMKHMAVIIESDHNSYNENERAEIERTLKEDDEEEQKNSQQKADEDRMEDEDDEEEENEEERSVHPRRVGYPLPPEGGKWASCVRLYDFTNQSDHVILELEDNEAAISVLAMVFGNASGMVPGSQEQYVIVGTVKDMKYHPRQYGACFVRTYKVVQQPQGFLGLQFVHSTQVEEIPYAMCPFQGRLLLGVGSAVRIYGKCVLQ